jgi:hypothetical protein
MFRRALSVIPLMLIASCSRSSTVRPTPPPPFAGKPIDSVSTSAIIAYANTLQFDSVKPADDTLTVTTPPGDTIHLQASPEIGTLALTDSELAQGRILARIQSTGAFAPLGTAKGTNYFWVSGTHDRAQVVMIPADSSAPRVTHPLGMGHQPLHFKVSTARFLEIGSEGTVIFLINVRCSDICCNLASDYRDADSPKVDSALKDMHDRMNNGGM